MGIEQFIFRTMQCIAEAKATNPRHLQQFGNTNSDAFRARLSRPARYTQVDLVAFELQHLVYSLVE
jgi:hypothetical protein